MKISTENKVTLNKSEPKTILLKEESASLINYHQKSMNMNTKFKWLLDKSKDLMVLSKTKIEKLMFWKEKPEKERLMEGNLNN